MNESIKLRPLNSDDELFLYELLNDEHVLEYGYLTEMFPQNDYLIKERMKLWQANTKTHKNYVIAVDIQPLGLAQIHGIDYINRKCALAILLLPEYSAKGYGKTVFNDLINIAFNRLNLNKIEVQIAEQNIGSIKLAESSNFKREGTKRKSLYKNGEYQDIHLYGLLQEEYKWSGSSGKQFGKQLIK